MALTKKFCATYQTMSRDATLIADINRWTDWYGKS